MDVAYNQHSHAARRKHSAYRSSANLNHVSLAPLRLKIPINDSDDYDTTNPFSAPPPTTSYLQGKSAPTTPRLLSRSPPRRSSASRSASRGGATLLPKSKSATHLAAAASRSSHTRHAGTSPVTSRHNGNGSSSSNNNRDSGKSDADWLLRAGAFISTETRESKGQGWLVSRASSTSLAGPGLLPADDAEQEAAPVFGRDEQQQSQPWTTSRHGSRRNSAAPTLHDDWPSPAHSRFGSRPHSRVGSRSRMMTPVRGVAAVDDYFGAAATNSNPEAGEGEEESIPGPDFVNLDERLEAVEVDTTADDEAYVRRLVKRGNNGVGSWLGDLLGVKLFSVQEDEEESEGDGDGEGETTEGETDNGGQERPSSSLRRLQGVTPAVDTRIPPPKADEGGWHDAAWLLTVASKVFL
ncbi:hypothetical protein VTK56DRAFT_7049 [Thermocarpiscus australiensis]